MQHYFYPHVIENGAGERLVFLRTVAGTGGDRLEGETYAEPGAGPPMHVHRYQAEGFTVLEGRLAYQRLGEPPQFAGPGESVEFKPGEVHRFWNAGADALRCASYVEPADNAAYFLTELFAAMQRSGTARPGLFDAAFLMTRYRREYAMVEIPAMVRRLVFPVVKLVGSLLGRYDRYADAPPPVRR